MVKMLVLRSVVRKIFNSRQCRCISTTQTLKKSDKNLDDNIDDILSDESDYKNISESYFHIGEAHRCLIIQPYVKWGPKKLPITPEEQLEEAVSLIETLSGWRVEETVNVPLDTLERKSLFKTGSMERLQQTLNKNRHITAVFVNTGHLKPITTTILQENFSLPIFDRYKIVMQILKLHATSKQAKLQVALAELYYFQRKAQKNMLFFTHNTESLKLMFQEREQKLKKAIEKLREQRSLLRNKRKNIDYPVAAVVGYTNAGKTSIIKALTGEEQLRPKNQLFATLDVTLHAGILPSGLEILYVDTVGFISDIPTNLIECFVATLEDAVLADVIILVEDLSSSCFEYKRKHVLDTLRNLSKDTENNDIMQKVIHIGNKCDLVKDSVISDVIPVSAKERIGLDNLRYQVEDFVLKTTKRLKITIRCLSGGDEIRWLYKNATVISQEACEKDSQFALLKTIITHSNLEKFKHYFSRVRRDQPHR